MLKAAALYYAIVISVLIAVISAMLLLYTRYSLMELSYYDRREQLIRNSESGMLLLRQASAKEYLSGQDISLFGDSRDSVALRTYAWGIYRIGVSRSHQCTSHYTSTAFLGALPAGSYIDRALYLSDHQTALGFCGKAKIVGDALLPKMGTRLNFVEGKTAESGILIDGDISLSQSSIPLLQAEEKSMVEAQFSREGRAADDTVVHWPIIGKKLYRGYAQTTLRLELPAHFTLSDVMLIGNIKIVAPYGLQIDSSVHARGALFISPKIELLEGCKGAMQLLATDTVIVHKDCLLEYPSAVYIRDRKSTEEPSYLHLDDGVSIQGELYELGGNDGKSVVDIAKDAYVQGLIYAGNKLTLNGQVDGTVICDKFYLKTATAIYENQLLDGRIDRQKLPAEFLFSRLLMSGANGMISHGTEN